MKKFVVGNVLVRSLNLGDLSFRLKDTDNVPESEWKPLYSDVFENAHLYPSQCFHILSPSASILVDAGDYALFSALDSSYTPKNYIPPPDLFHQLSGEGIEPESITNVVITHAHYDHYSGVTRRAGDKISPSFPNAKYFLGRGDWNWEEMQKGLKDPNSEESKTLGFLNKEGLLEFVDSSSASYDLTGEVQIIPSPGESPGHQIVKISSKGDTLYCVGDLFHHALEVENLTWMAMWADPTANLKSRESLIKNSLHENVVIAPAHMPAGKLSQDGLGKSRVKFVPVPE